MDEYAIAIFNRLIEHFEQRMVDRKNRNALYMAKGAFLTYLQGSRRALNDLVTIMKWAWRMKYLTHNEYRIAKNMAGRLRRIVGSKQPTTLHKRRGQSAPWQEWPTFQINPKKGER
ncbi:MAG: hypothetical protein PF689_03650 [Deltaproteobacteria bacterium]|jgi:hypothetical protein|nr:hypothetical protein [Deltaproteobacteria bacterium]